MSTPQAELDALRKLIAEAKGPAQDAEVSPGALQLRLEFSEAAMRRLDARDEAWRVGKKREDHREE